jgi:2-oxoisovalerate dehydrogenase E2 component (dihydrolipoyl transacylase)
LSETRQFTLPDLGEGLVDAEIVRWLVQVGETVAVDQPVAEVESAKAAVELPSPFAGVVQALHAEVGATVVVGAPLVSIEVGEPAGAAAEPAAAPGSSKNVLVGYGTSPHPRRTRARTTRPDAPGERPSPPAAGSPEAAAPDSPAPDPPAAAAPSSARPAVVSPVVRRLARSNDIDLGTLNGSGPGGLIVRADVERAIAAATAGPAEAAEQRIPLRGRRRAIADKLTRSHREIPDVATWVDVDATGLLAARDAIATAQPEARIGLLALLARFTVAGLQRFPALNARVDLDRGEIVQLRSVHLGFAAQADDGLVVPVVKDAHRRTTIELAAELARLTGAARAGTLRPQDLTGGTFTLNNYGVLGVDGATPIINHPEVAILGMSRVLDRPWVVDGQLTVRKLAQLTLVFDHRVCDGAVAAGFLRYVADCVEQPARLLGAL